MMTNAITWSIHVAVLIFVGVFATHVFRWRSPQSRLRFFQLLLLLSILLPFVGPREVFFAPAVAPNDLAIQMKTVAPLSSKTPLRWDIVLLTLYWLGVAAQLGFLAVGLSRLSALRKRGTAVKVEGIPHVDIREVHGLKGPAAFGWRDPVILLPFGLSGVIREVALRHELQHVLRADWMENMIERTLASLLWFHPAVWWLAEQIHLAREQAVDLEVAGDGTERDQYLDSLLTSAGLADSFSLPAAGFVRRPSHLVERVAFLTKETTMSIRATMASATMTTILTGASLTIAGIYFPFQLKAYQSATRTPTSMRIQRPVPAGGVEGTVQLDVTFNDRGEVIDARVLSGPNELKNAALKAVLAMQISPDQATMRVIPVTIEFSRNAILAPPPPPPPPPPVDQAEFEGIDYQGLTSDQQQRAASVLSGIQTGQHLTQSQIDGYRAALKAADPLLVLGVFMNREGSGPVRLRLSVRNGKIQPTSAIRVGGNVMKANLLNSVEPVYPPLARQARIQGTVRFTVVIGKDGSVQSIGVESGHPLLIPAAQEAMRQYKYRPTMLNGQPAEVQSTVDITFVL